MMPTTLLQSLIARLDLVLPWLLPVLENIDQTVPATIRLLLCALLLAWLAVLRHRHAESASSLLHRVML